MTIMKKILAAVVCCILICSMSACSKANNNVKDQENVDFNPIGTYTDVSFADTNSLYTDFMPQDAGKVDTKETIKITEVDGKYLYQDSCYSGSITDNGDNDFTVCLEEVITENPAITNMANLALQNNPYMHYTLYEGYLVENTLLDITGINGELPSETNKTACFININKIPFSTYSLSFSADGTCFVMTMFNGDVCQCSGTYSVEGKIISITFNKGTFYGQELTGKVEMALYVEDGKLYNEVYQIK